MRIKKLCIAVVVAFSAFIAYTNAVILLNGHGSIYTGPIAQAPHRDTALIFAGGSTADGRPSPMAGDRVDRGVELYKAGIVKTLIMTGDDGAFRIEEVEAMRRYAESQGVTTTAILVDPHGYRTYDSCYRARAVYGLADVIAVSQLFHVSRISYLCNHFGVHVIGIPSEFHVFLFVRAKVLAREIGARAKAWIDVNLWPPRLRYFDAF